MSRSEPTLYELLEVDESAGEHEITLAFRRVAKRWHPDLNSTVDATERMQHISAAYAVLRDPERRADYDRALDRELSHSEPEGCGAPEKHRAPTWAPRAPSSGVIPDAGPPPGFRTPPHPFSVLRSRRRRIGRRPAQSYAVASVGGLLAEFAVVACVLVCPAVPFLLAAGRHGGGRSLGRWGCAYLFAPVLFGLGIATGAGLALLAALALMLIGVVHAACWRERLAAPTIGSITHRSR